MSEFNIRQVTASDLDRCYEIEQDAYEGDEAASKEKIDRRIREYPQGFLVFELDASVVGFINCGATNDVDMANEAFKDLVGHDAGGDHVVVFSLVVHRAYQHQGIAAKLMPRFIEGMRRLNKVAIHLICRHRLVGFYKKFGFEYIGPSAATHGGWNWHEMVLRLQDGD